MILSCRGGFFSSTLFLLLLTRVAISSQIEGKVVEHITERPVPEALISVEKVPGNKVILTVIADKYGEFRIEDLPSGTYNFEAYHDGYFGNILFDVKINKNKDYSFEIRLLEKREETGEEYCFLLGGIKICSERTDIIPEEPITVRKIESGEIEHLQAASLGDILMLIPGVEKSRNPGLSNSVRVGVRTAVSGPGSVNSLESFGTTVIVDGIPLTNDANANAKGEMGTNGIDLRIIPADNIESVEVISGIPSVEYGNFTNGIVKVITRSGSQASRLKTKFNPDTKTASFSSGIRLGESVLDYHLNYGFSERDLRKQGDEYHRIYFRGNLIRSFLNDKMRVKYLTSFRRLFDEEEPTDIYRIRDYNRGYELNNALDLKFEPSKKVKYSGFLSLRKNRRKVHKEKWVTDQIVLDDSIYTGYVGKYDEIGNEWQTHFTLKRERLRNIGNVSHNFFSGFEWEREWNSGKGFVLDSVFNYYGSHSSRRSYSFSEYKPISAFYLYAQDHIKGLFSGRKYNFIVGLRYELFNPETDENGKLVFRQGQFLSPRANFQFFFSDNFRMRIGAGRSVKNVSLAYIYKPPAYQKFLQEDSLVEEIQYQRNPDLKAFSTEKYEFSLDYKLKDFMGFSFTLYREYSDDRPVGVTYPWGYDINPDTLTEASYSIYENRGWKRSHGMELVLQTKRVFGLELQVSLTNHFVKTGRKGLIYDSKPDTSWEDIWYKPSLSWRRKGIANYQVNYISQRFGLWVTMELQHIFLDHSKEVFRSSSTIREVDGVERVFYQGMTYWYDDKLDKYDHRFLFNFRISKSLGQNSEVSLYINNFPDDRALMKNQYSGYYYELNPPIFYGVETSFQW